jgi:HAD superfamily hydrolase (TIGR01509 family)
MGAPQRFRARRNRARPAIDVNSTGSPRRASGVGFDIDHTLCIDNKLERVAFLHLLERVVLDGGRALGPLAQEIDRIDQLLVCARGGEMTIEGAVSHFVAARGATPSDAYVEHFKSMALTMADSFVVPDPAARPTLAALERLGVPTAVLSNGWNPLQVTKARRAGFPGPVLASASLGVQKPDPLAFMALADELDLPPDRCLYIGDDPRTDVAGALACGFQAVWLDHEGKSYPGDLPAPTHVVHGLEEVLALVVAEAKA